VQITLVLKGLTSVLFGFQVPDIEMQTQDYVWRLVLHKFYTFTQVTVIDMDFKIALVSLRIVAK
jgi:hypothetical protein